MNSPTTEETYHVSNILKHYAHAKEKHPYFCDMIAPVDLDEERRKGTLADYQASTSYSLATMRDNIACDAQNGRLTWELLLLCESLEISDAIANGDTAHAVEECYDAIAVLLRTVDVLKGWQELGKPEAKGETK